MKITHLTQPTKYSCVTTCLAMLLGKNTPDDIVAEYHPKFFSGEMNTYQLMDELGISYQRLPADSNILCGRTYLLGVPSLNILGGMHQIIAQTSSKETLGYFEIYDPAKGRPTAKHYISDYQKQRKNAVHLLNWEVTAEIEGVEQFDLSVRDFHRAMLNREGLNAKFADTNKLDFAMFMSKRGDMHVTA